MRVLHLLDHAARRRSDYRRRSLDLLGQLRAQGVQTVHLTAPPADGAPEAAADATNARAGGAGQEWHFYRTAPPWRVCRHPGAVGRAAALATLAWRLRQLTRLTRPDLIHVHAPGHHTLAALPVARLGRLPLIVDAARAAEAPDSGTALERWALRRADALAAGSAEQRASLRVQGWPAGRIAVIPPAPDLAAAPIPAHARAPAGLVDAPLIVYAGRLRHEDGLDLLLSVLPALRRRFPPLRLLLAGDGAREDELAERLRAPGLRGHVVATGPLACRRAADLLPRADIAVFPALPGPHAMLPSRHLLNAMAQGCAIVASDIACHRDLLVHGHSGVLFGAGSGAALLDALLRLLDQPWRQAALGQAAASFVAGERSWEATARRYRRLYEAVLVSRTRPGSDAGRANGL